LCSIQWWSCSALTNHIVFNPVVILFCIDQPHCAPSSGDLVLYWPTTLCSFQWWSCIDQPLCAPSSGDLVLYWPTTLCSF
jgi:hypothetical protein